MATKILQMETPAVVPAAVDTAYENLLIELDKAKIAFKTGEIGADSPPYRKL